MTNGGIGWERTYDGIGHSLDITSAIAVDNVGNVYVTGRSLGSGEIYQLNFDYASVKYCKSLCGDVNCDNQVTVSDLTYLTNYLFRGGPPPCPTLLAGDVNCDEFVTISNVIFLNNYLFKNGLPPCDPDNDGVEECRRP